MEIRPATFRSAFLPALLLTIFRFNLVQSAERPPLPLEVQRSLAWLPLDTETLVVAQSFKIPSLKERDAAAPNARSAARDSEFSMHLYALEGLFDLDKGKYLEALAGKRIVLALRGARNFDVVSSFGSLRNEGYSIIAFENKLDDPWLRKLRADAKEVRRIAGRDVFVFPSTAVMEPWEREKPWQGTFFVLLTPDTLLCATSDEYLKDVLKRVDGGPADRALADGLPEWASIDPKSPGWLLRHLPERKGRTINGLTLTFTKDQFRVAYFPAENAAKSVESRARELWTSLDPEVRPDIQRDDDGTVTMSLSALEPFVWSFCNLPGDDGMPISE
jgi:hypothetical protein